MLAKVGIQIGILSSALYLSCF